MCGKMKDNVLYQEVLRYHNAMKRNLKDLEELIKLNGHTIKGLPLSKDFRQTEWNSNMITDIVADLLKNNVMFVTRLNALEQDNKE